MTFCVTCFGMAFRGLWPVGSQRAELTPDDYHAILSFRLSVTLGDLTAFCLLSKQSLL